MEETAYFSLVTDLGTKEMAAAVHDGRKVNIVNFAVGDGGGQYYKPETTMTELKHEVWRGKIGRYEISAESENVLVVETVLPSDAGGFTIREMAVFDENGTMIAICNTPDTAKVRVIDGVVHELLLQMEILLNNKDSVNLVVNPNVVTATKKDIENLRREFMNKFNYLFSLLCGYHYNRAQKKIVSLLPHELKDGILTFPEGMAYAQGDKVVLRHAGAGTFPSFPGSSSPGGDLGGNTSGAGSMEEIAEAAAKIVEGNLREISPGQVTEMFRGRSEDRTGGETGDIPQTDQTDS